jgi:fatty acid desaturase
MPTPAPPSSGIESTPADHASRIADHSPLPSLVREPEEHIHTHWVCRAAFPLIVLGLVLSQAATGVLVYHDWYWLAIPCLLLASHFMHGTLIAFHEASHCMLRKSRFLNDADGVIIGTLSLMSFTLYRVAHQTHHSHLATTRDEELWPFVNVDSPRWKRRLVAFIELNVGILFTPFLFVRMFLKKDSFIRNKKVRRRIWMEFALVAVFNGLLYGGVTYFHQWPMFLWTYLVPGIIAGNLQSWRKYVEHVGVCGDTAKSATRSIVDDTWFGRLVSVSLLHEPFHAIHHLRAGIPHAELPHHAKELEPKDDGDIPVFPSYTSAIGHLMRNLSDPRAGSHWPKESY